MMMMMMMMMMRSSAQDERAKDGGHRYLNLLYSFICCGISIKNLSLSLCMSLCFYETGLMNTYIFSLTLVGWVYCMYVCMYYKFICMYVCMCVCVARD